MRFPFQFIMVLVLCATRCMADQPKHEDDKAKAADLLSQAYAALPADNAKAISLLERAAELDPANVVVRRQLGSSYIAAARPEDALRQFSIANTLMPSDTTRLQMAYLLNGLGRDKEALSMFSGLKGSADPDIRSKARTAEVVLCLAPCPSASSWWSRLSLSPYYDSRFENTVLTGAFRLGYYPGSQRAVSFYGVAAVTKDTRSESGAVPVIFSDNYALAGLGLRVQPISGLSAELQGGVAIDLMDRPGMTSTEGDFRSVLSYGVGTFPELAVPDGMRLTFKPFVDMYLSGGYYSRYKNTIGYAQLRAGFRAMEWRTTALDLYLRGDGAADSKREYYNNIAEAGIGLRFIPSYIWHVSILAEYHRGTYWDTGLSTGPYSRWYDTFRLMLVLEQPFCFN